MKARANKQLLPMLGALCLSVSSICSAAEALGYGEQPALPQAVACGSAMIPVLRAVEDLRREQAALARGTDTTALRVVEARLAVAIAVQLYTLRRYAGSDTADAITAMRAAIATAEALPREQGFALVASARTDLRAMLATADAAGDARPQGARQ